MEFAISALTAWLLIHYLFITAAIAAFAALLCHRSISRSFGHMFVSHPAESANNHPVVMISLTSVTKKLFRRHRYCYRGTAKEELVQFERK